MNTTDGQTLKDLVKEKYGQIATNPNDGCCGSACGCSTTSSFDITESYKGLKGYVADADYGLGCGLPTEYALIKEGNVVVDLGSGAGNDAFIARSIVGPHGKVVGVDFTENMVSRARDNAQKLGYKNVEFRLGDIEDVPIANNAADVVISNCVLNLVPDKQKAFSEMFRILKPGGHFSVSDIVLLQELPASVKSAAELYAGCVSGALLKNAYVDMIQRAGFSDIEIQKERTIDIPETIWKQYISEQESKTVLDSPSIVSLTIFGRKPEPKEESCCGPTCCKN
jgi:arsenite methyltransferase